MKLNLYSLVMLMLFGMTISSCTDTNEEDPIVSIKDYFKDKNITDFTETVSGLYYHISEEGEGVDLTPGDIVVSNVVLSTLNGNVVYSSQYYGPWFINSFTNEFYAGGLTDPLELTDGMIELMPLIPLEGVISGYIPSALAYGENGSAVFGIRANEDIRFDISHVRIKRTLEEYIAENQLTDFNNTSTGLYYKVEVEGEGDFPVGMQKVTVDYTGTFMNGTKFDSSKDTGRTPFTFELGAETVIAGWDEGIPYFKKGGSGKLLIPYHLAYSEAGRFNPNTGSYAIEPYTPLIFEIELLDIQAE